MRVWLASAAALVVLAAVVLALWLGRSERETEKAKRRVEDVVEQVQAAAELAASRESESAARAEVPSAAPLSAAQAEAAPAPAAEAELIVQVLGEEDGAPLPGVPLFHEPWPERPRPDGFSQTLVSTDEQGLATLQLPPGGSQVYSPTQGDRRLIVELAPGERREGILRLRSRPDLDVHLLVVDAHGGAPLAGVEVELHTFPEENAVGPLGKALSAEDGRVALRIPSWVAYDARVAAAGYTPLNVILRGAHGTREDPRRIALGRTARLEGSVKDGGGSPRTGIAVTANAQEEGDGFATGAAEHLAEFFWSSPVDADGHYALADLPAGVDLALAVRRGEGLVLEEPAFFRLAPGEVRVHDLVLDAGAIIRGIVLDATGAPAAHLALWLARGDEPRELNWFEDPVGRTATDGEGRFAFEGAPRGTWLIAPQPLEHRPLGYPLSLGQVVELPEGVPAVEVELRLPSGLSVSGRCEDREGEPVAGVTISAVSLGAFATASGESAPDGTFDIGPLPAGELVLMVDHDTLALDGHELPRVHAGDTGVVVRMAHSARVRGTVVDATTGLGVSGTVLAFAGDLTRSGGTGPDSAFAFSGLPPGRCVLVARTSPGLVSAPYAVDLAPGEEREVELQVAPGAQVHVLLPEDQGQVLAHLLVEGRMVAWLGGGSGNTALVPPGPLTVELRNLNGLLASKQVTVAAGETVEVDLR